MELPRMLILHMVEWVQLAMILMCGIQLRSLWRKTPKKWRVSTAIMCWVPVMGSVYWVPRVWPPVCVLFVFEKVISSVLAGSA